MTRTATVVKFEQTQRRKRRAAWAANDKRDETLARVLLTMIREQLPHAVSFSRDDIMQFSGAIQDTAIATRYNKVSRALSRLLQTKRLAKVDVRGVHLCLPENAGKTSSIAELREIFQDQVETLVSGMRQAPFTVIEIVDQWTADPAVKAGVRAWDLTLNTKREIVRAYVRQLHRNGELVLDQMLRYNAKKD